ncbi:MAG: type II toxin-antitoxin system VapC family toxin [Nitrospira sp.]|nr:type II toxin-antitoxin system VapC family toxin [Nitrospira sp.]
MPYYYFDSTALIKRYSMERGTRIVNKLMVKRGKVAIVPTWTVTDFYSILCARAHEGQITRDDCYSVLYKFEIESKQGLYRFIAPRMETYLATKELVLEYPSLRSPQVMHLALALELKPLRLTVVSADSQLLAASKTAGLHIINPTED